MNKNTLSFIILAIAITQVVSETNSDVIESFAFIFDKLHQSINEIQTKTHGSIHLISRRFPTELRNTEYALTEEQNKANNSVNEQIRETLKQLKLSSDNDKVKTCVSDSIEAVEKLIIKSQGGLQVCKTIEAEQIDDVNVMLSGVYTKEEKIHRDVEDSKVNCNITAKDPGQLRNCLYYYSFVVNVDSIKDLKVESEKVVNDYEAVYETAVEKLKSCSKVVKKIILDESSQITLRFRNCCSDVVPTNVNN